MPTSQSAANLFTEHSRCLQRYTNQYCWLHQAIENAEDVIDSDYFDELYFAQREVQVFFIKFVLFYKQKTNSLGYLEIKENPKIPCYKY